jgi:hypothetical protein
VILPAATVARRKIVMMSCLGAAALALALDDSARGAFAGTEATAS